MKAQELRIGNYILDKDGTVEEVYQLQSLAGDTINEDDYCSNVKPIPLTKEWLVKFGFSHDGHGFFKHPTENFCLYHNVEGGYFECYKEVPANDETGQFKILKYVHKLQNLFYELFEEELTIKEG